MPIAANEDFTFVGGVVEPGERTNLRYTVSETYLGDPVRIPVTIINGTEDGPIGCLTAASHGDELNGIEVVRTVAQEWDLNELAGALVCLPVLNVPGFLSQQRYLPILDRDLNRSFPGSADGTSAKRIAHRIFSTFIEGADFLLDFHTSTRGRNNMLHVRANLEDPTINRLARSLGSTVIIDSEGPSGSLRREAQEADVPAVTVEMGQAHRFQRGLIDSALAAVESVFAEFGVRETHAVDWPGWRTIIDDDKEKTWMRADAGGIVEVHHPVGTMVYEGDRICTITNPFMGDDVLVEAPFTGLIVGVLENPVVYPGNPICHLVEISDDTKRVLEQSNSDLIALRADDEVT